MTSYSLEHVSEHGPPGDDIVPALLDAAQASSGEPADALTVVPYVAGAEVDAHVVAGAGTLRGKGVALAVDQPRGVLFLDPTALRRVIEKYPTILDHPPELTFGFRDLCEALLYGGCTVWNISIERSGMLGIHQKLTKRPWHRPGKRWWQVKDWR